MTDLPDSRLDTKPFLTCPARRVHPMQTDYYVTCKLPRGHEGGHANSGVNWTDDSEYALPPFRESHNAAHTTTNTADLNEASVHYQQGWDAGYTAGIETGQREAEVRIERIIEGLHSDGDLHAHQHEVLLAAIRGGDDA